jgi:WD40 repeat protein
VTLPASINTRTTYTVEFSPDGSLLATGENFGAVRFWNYPPDAAPTPIGSAINFANSDSVNDIAFSPNGQYLAVGGAFYSKRLSIYSVSTHAEVATVTPSADVVSLVFAPSGNAIIAGLDDCGTVLVCN